LNRLTDTQVKNASPGKHNDGGGLWLIKRKDGGAQWIYRFSLHGKRPEMGLGSYPSVKLADARRQSARWREVLGEGRNPIKERQRLSRIEAKARPTLEAMSLETFEARKRQLINDGKDGRWSGPLRLHVLPHLGTVPIEEIDQRDIKRALSPIWHDKPETARKAITRLGLVFKHAAAAGLDVDLQATEKAKALLGSQGDTPERIPALDWHEVPAFYKSLNEGTVTQLALRLLILTGLRSKPIRFLHVDHIEGDIITVPAEFMKGPRGKRLEFRLPLSQEAQSVIEEARKFERDGYLFPSVRKGVISDATMSRFMERRGMNERPHGFRSSFRTWCAEATDTPREIAETALAHVSGGKVELAYRRTDYLEQRRMLMERWASHVLGDGGQVLRMAH
jgi:integrase